MSNRKNKVYQSFIRKPTIAGLSVPLFGLEVLMILLLLVWFGFGLISWILIGLWVIYIHGAIRKAEQSDPHYITLWLANLIYSQNQYRPAARIDQALQRTPRSIPKMR